MQVQKQKGQKKKNKLQLWHPFTIFFFFWVCRRSTRVDASSTSNRHVFMLTLNSPSPTHGHWWLPVLWRSFWAPSLVSISQRLEVNDEAGQMQGGDVKAGELLPESGEEDGQLSRSWQWIWFYFVGEGRWRREADRSTVQDGGGGKTQSSCSWISGQREGGNGILAVWQKAALLWYAVGNVACGGTVAGNHHPPEKKLKKNKKNPKQNIVSCLIKKMCLEAAGV